MCAMGVVVGDIIAVRVVASVITATVAVVLIVPVAVSVLTLHMSRAEHIPRHPQLRG